MRVLKEKRIESKELAFSLRIDSELRDKLRKIADANEVSLNTLIIKILETAIEDKSFVIKI